MPGQFVQFAAGSAAGTSPATVTFLSAPIKGDLIIVAIFVVASPPPAITSLTDTQGNVYTQAVAITGGGFQNLIYYALANGGSGPNKIVLTWVPPGTITMVAAEYLGPWSVSLLVDNSASSEVPSGTSIAYTLVRSSAARVNVPDLVVTLNSHGGSASNFSGLSGTDRSGITNVSFEYNDFIQPSGPAAITATVSNLADIISASASFYTITEPILVQIYAIDDILSIVNDELHGKKNAFSEAQKIRHINKSLDEMWKIMKVLHQGYWMTNNTPGLVLDLVNTDFILPVDFAEVRLIEVTNPIDYVGIDVIRMPMTSGIFKSERQAFRAAQTIATADSVLVIPGQLNYDIYGPDATNQMHILFSRPAPVPLTLLIWYIRLVGHFSVPKLASETLQSLLSPYIWDLAVYAAKSLLKSESSDQGEFAKWEEQWSKGIDRSMPAAHERATADEDVTEGFVEL